MVGGKVNTKQEKKEAKPKTPAADSRTADRVELNLPVRRPTRQRTKSYNVEDILAGNKAAFLKRIAPKEALQIPDLGFTEEEKQTMDETIRQNA
jgi:hypothetical protein